MKEKKDLSLVYALKEYGRVNGKGGLIIEDKRCFTLDDIKAAFNAGRESVVENMPELVWNCFCEGLKEFYASCPIGWRYKVSYNVNEFDLFCNDCFLSRFLSFEEAKRAANEHYKKQIKQALGL